MNELDEITAGGLATLVTAITERMSTRTAWCRQAFSQPKDKVNMNITRQYTRFGNWTPCTDHFDSNRNVQGFSLILTK